MSDAKRQLATDLGMLFAKHMLTALPEAKVLLQDASVVTVAASVRIATDKTGTLRCRMTVTPPRAPRERPKVFTLALTEDQTDLFR
jgi:hypothetical protein